MSHSGKQLHEMGLDSLSDRFQSCNLYHKKPDFRELDLGSRNSPLVSRRGSKGGGGSNTATSTSLPSPLSNKTPFVKQCDGNSKSGHRRSMSSGSPLIYSGCYNSSSSGSSSSGGGSSATNSGGSSGGGTCLASVSSPNAAMYPTGNICPSGKILKSNMGSRPSTRPDTLGSGSGNYGHGSIVRNTHSAGELAAPKGAMSSSDPEDLKKAGNELYRKGNFVEALLMYDRAIAILPENAAYRSNRAAALTMVGRLGEAVTECEEAVRLDPGYGRAHQRLASLYLRLGQVENARRHLCSHTQQSDKAELQKLILLEKHLKQCVDDRKVGDWKSALRECDAAMVEGADSSPQITACKAEAFLKLNKLENADSSLSSIMKLETYPTSCSQTKFFGMLAEAYVFYVQAKVDMAFGRFENAVAAAEKASLIDFNNIEIAMLLNNVKLVIKARSRGKDLFDSGRFSDACTAFGEGLKYDLSNSVLYCNRAVCWSKLKLWDESVEDCNRALKIQPNYTKALLRRAVSNAKLERWAAAVKDYEVLKRELPGDNEVAESLLRAQVALKRLRLEEFHNASCTGEVEEVSSLHRFKAAISSPGLSVVLFKAASNQQCQGFSSLSIQYPSINFLKVDVEDSPEVAQAESIRTVPTFNVYKNGVKVREMISPSHRELESFLRQQSL